MRFSTVVSLLFASAVVAVPVTAPGAVTTRDTACSVGVPCWVSAIVNNEVDTVNYNLQSLCNVVSILQNNPVADVSATLDLTASSLSDLAAYLKTSADALVAAEPGQVDNFKATLNAAVASAVVDCTTQINLVTSIAPGAKAHGDAVVSALLTIQAVIGKCTAPS